MIMCVLLCYPVAIRTYYQQGVLFLVEFILGCNLWPCKNFGANGKTLLLISSTVSLHSPDGYCTL